jgi:uncharacterized UBP type Zn finger protein
MKAYFTIETVDYTCKREACDKHMQRGTVIKTSGLAGSLSGVTVVTLNRFVHDDSKYGKKTHYPVMVHQEEMIDADEVGRAETWKKPVRGIIPREGETHAGGHYVTYLPDRTDEDTWWKYNDAKEPVAKTFDQVAVETMRTGYVYFLARVHEISI